MTMLAVSSFGGGVVKEGSADVQRTDELQSADSYDIGPRGQLVAASDLADIRRIFDNGGVSLLGHMLGIGQMRIPGLPLLIIVGDNNVDTFVIKTQYAADGSDLNTQTIASSAGVIAGGSIVTMVANIAAFTPGTRIALINIGARATAYPRTTPGLYILSYSPAATYALNPVSNYDALGTGTASEDTPGGTHGKQLYFRGIVGYNSHCFGWGFLNADATNGEGQNRLMFSNIGDMTKWGLDPGPAGTDRAFTDSDAIVIGSQGSVIRAGYVWNGRLWIGCNDGLYYVEGYGRESFTTNGFIAFSTAKNVIGPYAMVEGPDRMLYGVSDQGLWRFSDDENSLIGNKLRDFSEKSLGYWDLIWTDPTQPIGGYPGRTNQDLVWMLADPVMMQVWVVIPFCNAAQGYGQGTDTVIIKYHCLTGGFTRQVFTGQTLTAGTFFKRDPSAIPRRFVCSPGHDSNLRAYANQATANASPILPAVLPDATHGEYAPHGVDGVGVCRKLYLTLSWEAAASLPLVFTITPYVDQKVSGSVVHLSVQTTEPVGPSDGDVWVDTSGTDTNLGNGTAGAFIPASPADYLVKRWSASRTKWDYVYVGGQQGARISVPIPYQPGRGTRVKYRVQCMSAAGRYQIEGLGIEPATIRSDR
jgi:hypothetical protein